MSDLAWVIKNGDLDQVKDVIENQSIDVNTELSGRYPIHYAADFGHADILSYLLSKGAKVDIADKHGILPLLAAIWEGHTDCVKMLLAKGAAKNGKSPDGTPFIDCADKEEIKNLLN